MVRSGQPPLHQMVQHFPGCFTCQLSRWALVAAFTPQSPKQAPDSKREEPHKKLERPEVMTCSATPSPGMSAANREPPSSETRDGMGGGGGGAVRLLRGGCS